MPPYTPAQSFFVEWNPTRVIELSPDASLLCVGRGNLRLDLIDLVTCFSKATITFQSTPTAVLWKCSRAPHLLIVGLRDGSFTAVTANRRFEVTVGQTYRSGASAYVSAIAMSDVHGILAIATGPIVHIYRFEQGTSESQIPIASDYYSLIIWSSYLFSQLFPCARYRWRFGRPTSTHCQVFGVFRHWRPFRVLF